MCAIFAFCRRDAEFFAAGIALRRRFVRWAEPRWFGAIGPRLPRGPSQAQGAQAAAQKVQMPALQRRLQQQRPAQGTHQNSHWWVPLVLKPS